LIFGIEGDIYKKEPTKVYLKCYGVVYEVSVSINTSSKLESKNCFLYTKEIIREDSRELYGFYDKTEKELFEKITKISGIGAKTAIAILSTFTPEQFFLALSQKDQTALQKVPGIGLKSAARILVELEGFVSSGEGVVSSHSEAVAALEGLGFKRDEISKLLSGIESTNTSDIVKEALKKIKR